MRRTLVVGICVGAFVLFFLLAPVIGFFANVCTASIGPSYESLSFRLFDVGEVYYTGQFHWMTQGFPPCF